MSSQRSLLVVGGTSGIGLAVVQRLTSSWTVYAAGRTRRKLPAGAHSICMDVLDELSVASGIARIAAECNEQLDALVYCAGITRPQRAIRQFNREEWDVMWNTNVTGAILCLKHAHPLLKSAAGRVVFVNSVAAQSYSRFSSFEYTTSKAALSGLARQLAMDWAEDRILVNSVYPSMTLTPMLERQLGDGAQAAARAVPIGSLVRPEEVARAVDYLIDQANVSMTGAGIDLNGGMNLR